MGVRLRKRLQKESTFRLACLLDDKGIMDCMTAVGVDWAVQRCQYVFVVERRAQIVAVVGVDGPCDCRGKEYCHCRGRGSDWEISYLVVSHLSPYTATELSMFVAMFIVPQEEDTTLRGACLQGSVPVALSLDGQGGWNLLAAWRYMGEITRFRFVKKVVPPKISDSTLECALEAMGEFVGHLQQLKEW